MFSLYMRLFILYSYYSDFENSSECVEYATFYLSSYENTEQYFVFYALLIIFIAIFTNDFYGDLSSILLFSYCFTNLVFFYNFFSLPQKFLL